MLSLRQFHSSSAYIIIIRFFIIDILLYLSNCNVLCDTTISYNNNISNHIAADVTKDAVNLQHILDNTSNSRKHSSRLINTYYSNYINAKTAKPQHYQNETKTNDNGILLFSHNISNETLAPSSKYLSMTNTDYIRAKSNYSHYNQLCNLCHQSSTTATSAIKIINNKINENNNISIVSSTSSLVDRSTKSAYNVNYVNKTNVINCKRHRRHLINEDENGAANSSSKSINSDNLKNSTHDDSLAAVNNNVVTNSLTTVMPTIKPTLSSPVNNILAETSIVSTIIDIGNTDGTKNNNNNGEYMIDIGDTFGIYENVTCTDESCINHNITCMGDSLYCNYTYEEYVEMLYDYIYPTIPEWILIASHAVVFFMGLVSRDYICLSILVFSSLFY